MEPRSPEIPTSNNITLLKDKITEVSGFTKEITVRADNVGAQEWPGMLAGTQSDGRERGLIVYRNPLSKNKFTPSKIIVGEKTHIAPLFSDIGLKGFLFPIAAKIHTHPRTPEVQHLKTLIPVDGDLQLFFGYDYSAMITLDDGGAHLLIRTGESIRQDPPPSNLIGNAIGKEAARGGIVADVQKKLNTILSEYGISYFYTESLTPSEDGTVTFKKP
ncbi:hypothetical protein M1146_04655 [Patescibacteria group bacterium]|nr:hypothetical protein [Patescibacteria group bacterium]